MMTAHHETEKEKRVIDFASKEVLTFDCYGTLIDWEAGIIAALGPVLRKYNVSVADDLLLETFAEFEAEAERGPYKPYRDVLATTLRGIGRRFGFTPIEGELAAFAESVGDWPAFPDSPAALAALKRFYKLVPITNCDDDLFACSNERLGVQFDDVITAQQARSYKPSLNNFHVAFARLNVPRERILHVAVSLFHDHAPAKQLGLQTVLVDRRREQPGFGASPHAQATPDLTVPDLATLARIVADSRRPV
jgi:2-haloacid dehalogenase